MKEQEIYKDILTKLIMQTEKLQIKDTNEMMSKLIHELQAYRVSNR